MLVHAEWKFTINNSLKMANCLQLFTTAKNLPTHLFTSSICHPLKHATNTFSYFWSMRSLFLGSFEKIHHATLPPPSGAARQENFTRNDLVRRRRGWNHDIDFVTDGRIIETDC